MWGDGQHPPHLAGALDAIALYPPVHSCRPGHSHAGLSLRRALPAVWGPRGALAGITFQEPCKWARIFRNYLGGAEENLFLEIYIYIYISECLGDGFGLGEREDSSGGNGLLFKSKKTQNLTAAWQAQRLLPGLEWGSEAATHPSWKGARVCECMRACGLVCEYI